MRYQSTRANASSADPSKNRPRISVVSDASAKNIFVRGLRII